MDNDSEPPSSMNLTDLEQMALQPTDSQAACLSLTPGKETIALANTSFSAADSPSESSTLIDYNAKIQKRVGTLLEHCLYTDVCFLTGSDKTPVKAHRLILSIASPVFASMFHSKFGTEENICIPDCKVEAFSAMLKYIYTNEIPAMSLEESVDVLYVSRKYNIRGLEDACHLSLCNRVAEDTVFEIMNACSFYDLAGLSVVCWEYCEDNVGKVLAFHVPYINVQTLTKLMASDRLNIKEVDLFQHYNRWAENQCIRQEMDPTGPNKRKVSESLLKLIRFTLMSPTEFADMVVPTEVLTAEETANIFTNITASHGFKPQTAFPSKYRIPRFIPGSEESNSPFLSSPPGLSCMFEYMPTIQATMAANRRKIASATRLRNRH